jgi:hypothetical protein
MKKIAFLIIVVITVNACRMNVLMELVNSNGGTVDFNTVELNRFPIYFNSELTTTEGIKDYTSDSLDPRLAYELSFLGPKIPKITINSFSFKRKNGEIIPSVFFYKSDTGNVMINSLPVTFVEKDSLLINISGLVIYAECSESFHETKEVFVNFDIQIDTIRVDTTFYYSRKLFFDCRPKLF